MKSVRLLAITMVLLYAMVALAQDKTPPSSNLKFLDLLGSKWP